jgi:hypothetical protein
VVDRGEHSEAVDARHQQVEKHDRVPILFQQADGGVAIRGFVDEEPFRTHRRDENPPHLGVIVHHQNPALLLHQTRVG